MKTDFQVLHLLNCTPSFAQMISSPTYSGPYTTAGTCCLLRMEHVFYHRSETEFPCLTWSSKNWAVVKQMAIIRADRATSNKSLTLPFAHRKNIARLALNPRGNLLLTVDEDGRAILTNLPRRIALYHFSFRASVKALEFSPSGGHFAAGIGRQIEVWHTPTTLESTEDGTLEFAPFVRHRTYTGHYDTVEHIQWSSDSRFFLSASKDLSARIWSLNPTQGFVPTTLSGHRQAVRAAWFSKDQETVGMVPLVSFLDSWTDFLDLDDKQRWCSLPMGVSG